MGASASNTLNDFLSETVSVQTTVVQNCDAKRYKTNIISILGCGGTYVGNTVSIDDYVVGSVDCTASISNDTTINQTLLQQIQQSAEATVGALGTGVAVANNTANIMTQVAVTVSNSFSQGCNMSDKSQNSIFFDTCSQGCMGYPSQCNADVAWNTFSISSYSDLAVNCIQNILNGTKVTQDVTQNISQSATATVQGLGSLIILIIIIILVVVGSPVIFGGNLLSDPKKLATLLSIIAGLVMMFISFAKSKGYWPYSSDSSST